MPEDPSGNESRKEDRALVLAAQGGDQAAFRQLVEKYQRRVYQLAVGMVKDSDEAMDIAQETFVRVHRYLPSFKGDSSFFTWTYRIAVNLCLDSGRKRGRGDNVEFDEADADVEAGMDAPSAALAGPQKSALNRELAGKIEEALAGLSENHRAILLMREVDGLSYEDLSRALGIRKGTVMSRLFHARLKMQKKLREYLGAEADWLGREQKETEGEEEP